MSIPALDRSPRSAHRRRRLVRSTAIATAVTVFASMLALTPASALAPADDGAWRFDFGTETSPVADGYQQVLTTSLYTPEAGWGLTVPEGGSVFTRDRTGNLTPPDPIAEDYIAGSAFGFQLDDVPAGDYTVALTFGDALAGTSGTNLTMSLEGVAQARQTTGRGSTKTVEFETTVVDGRLDVGFVSSGSAFVGGLTVTPAVPDAPSGLTTTGLAWNAVSLGWNAVDGATSYRVLRADVADEAAGTFTALDDTTDTSYVDTDVEEGGSYAYAVIAVNQHGQASVPSAEVHSGEIPAASATARATFKFDLQPEGAPVMPGYVEANPSSMYTPEIGWGFIDPASMGSRDRGTGDVLSDLERDFVLPGSAGREFAVDVPDGTYEIKTYSGDRIASSKTAFAVEGEAAGSGNASSGTVSADVRGPFHIIDGQLNVFVNGSAARFNGLEITPILLGPTGLEVTSIDPDPAAPAATLVWDDEPGVTWRVYRTSPYDAEPILIDRVDTPTFTDVTARAGLSYSYSITAVDQTELESVPSATVDVSLTDPSVDPPAAPTNLTVERLEKREIEISWAAPVDAAYSLVFRSTVEGERGTLISIADVNRLIDTDEVLTTIPYYYTVVAVNAGGAGAASAQLETDAPTVLQRQAEYLDRAGHAMATDDGILVTWRLLGTDPASVAFHVYRDGTRITDEPIADSTNLLDADGDADSTYFISKVLNDVETTETEAFGVQASAYRSLQLEKPADAYTKDGQPYTYSANDVSVGDVDGDGQFEYFVKWYPSNAQDNSRSGYTGNVYLDAYRQDGTRLWRIDLGVNIRAGAHYTQYQVYDYDGDGRAELITKTADGTIDGVGQPIGSASADHRNSSGYILQGPEYLTVFDGRTGAAVDTVDYTPPRGDVGAWGDTYGNRVDRFLAGTAYLDGEHPSAVFSRGYYQRSVMAAYDFDGEQLTRRWVIDSSEPGAEGFYGEGNHSLSIADVDGDSKDEVIFGSATVDDNGTLLFGTGLGHGDAQHTTDLDPSRPGYESFSAHEEMKKSGNRGATMRDARTGEILWDIPADRDTGRAAAGDIDPRYAGAEAWAVGGTAEWNTREGYLMTASGERIGNTIPAANFLAWFDGDPLREIVDHEWHAEGKFGVPTISKWNWETQTEEVILADEGARSNNGTKGTPNLQADLFGDWREEIAWRSADSSELRIYSTTDVTEYRIPTLMHDMQYRVAVAWQNTGYNQPPHPSFFIGEGMEAAPLPSIAVTGAAGEGDTTAPVISGLPADGTLLPDSATYTVAVTAEDPESGVRNLDIAFDGEAVAPGQQIDLVAGIHTVSVTAVNHDGVVAQASAQLTVFEDEGATKAPARGTLSTDSGHDGLHDGSFTVSMNLWWGVNGSVFRLYENGELISTQLLDANSPNAQVKTVDVAGRSNGTYVYTGELINAVGVTKTTSVTVKVKDAAPATPVLSHDNWDRDGAYTLTSNLWWGTNATSYRLYENGTLIDEQQLVAASPNAQQAKTAVTGRSAGTYEYVAVFANAAGETSSKPVTVTVR